MNGTKLMHQFRALSDDDIAAFRKYLAVNGHRQLQSLWEYLLKHRDGPESRFEKKLVFEKLFPKEKAAYKDTRLRNVMALLSQQIEAFLIKEELEKDTGLKRQLLIRAYENRNNYFLFKTEISTRLRKLEAQKERGIEFFRECATLYHLLFFHLDTKGIFKPGKDLYQQLVRSFESWFTIGILSYESDFLVRKMLVNEGTPSQFIEIVLNKIDQVLEVEDNPVADVLLYICKLPASGLSFEYLESVYQRYQKASPMMGEFERNTASKALISRINSMIASDGDIRLSLLLFNMYKDAVQAEMYIEQGRISVSIFLNIAITGATAGDFEWTETFIKAHTPKIDEKDREYAVLLAQAYLNYNKGRKANSQDAGIHYEAAIDDLKFIKHGQPDYELRVRSLQLRIFYEYHLVINKNHLLLTDFSKSFRQYLHNQDNRLAEWRIQAYLDFIHFTLKLARFHGPATKKTLEKLEKTILAMKEKSTQMMMRHWLMEKAEELNKLLR